MPFTKETAREAGKRSKRSKDANVTTIRNLYAEFLNNNTDKIQSLFDKVAQEDAAKGLELLLKVSAFVLPKPTVMDEKGETDYSNVPTWLRPKKRIDELTDEEYQTRLAQAKKVVEAGEW